MSGVDWLAYEVGNLFIRLANRYGAEWTAKWATLDADKVAREWCEELRAFDGAQHRIAAVFDAACKHLPERAVNAPQFRRLCEQARDALYREAQARVQEQRGMPVRGPTPAEREALQAWMDANRRGGNPPGSAWAQRVVEAHEGDRPLATVVHGWARPPSYAAAQVAREVLATEAKRNAVRDVAALPPEELPDYWEPPMQEGAP